MPNSLIWTITEKINYLLSYLICFSTKLNFEYKLHVFYVKLKCENLKVKILFNKLFSYFMC